ncbi:hypothetical protein H8E88_29905 [candidate division KSB1 bacterium]|nr:hypothetical protein [candidate division KSB1 bacterium]MBL7093716.1 hypothetical protein [candidate division KSB1 bacterium]
MKKILVVLIIILIPIMLTSFCSTDKNPLPSVSHPEGWNTQGAENTHGAKVLETDYSSCKSCHGVDLKGGKTGKGCFDCHQTYPHPDEWTQFSNNNSHKAYIETNMNGIDYCKGCHGENLTGGKSGVSCFSCHKTGSLP